MRGLNYRWSSEDETTLIENYNSMTFSEMNKLFHIPKSRSAISRKAKSLNLKKFRYTWSSADDKLLIDNYETHSFIELGKLYTPHRPHYIMETRLKKLGKRKPIVYGRHIFEFCKTCLVRFRKSNNNTIYCSVECMRNRSKCDPLINKFFKNKINNIRSNAKRRRIKFELNWSDLLDLWQKQSGQCCYSGLDMRTELIADVKYKNVNPLQCSVDRIDNKQGYNKNNIVLCCYAVNSLKGEADLDTFNILLRAIKMNKTLKQIDVFKLTPNAVLPTRNVTTDAGIDLFAAENVFIKKGSSQLVQTQIAVNIPDGYVGKLAGRSSMNKKGIITSEGVIDSGYSGSVGVILNNFSCTENTDPVLHNSGYQVKAGDRIAQLLIYQVETPVVNEVSNLWESERGSKSFGSSGR